MKRMMDSRIVSISLLALFAVTEGLGSGGTLAVVSVPRIACGIKAGKSLQSIFCFFPNGRIVDLLPNISFDAISAGGDFLCGLRSGGTALLCWNFDYSTESFIHRRIFNRTRLTDLTVGENHVCAAEVASGRINCWRARDFSEAEFGIRSITSGRGFTCGIASTGAVRCWGRNGRGDEIQRQFSGKYMDTIVAGASHVCGFDNYGSVICRGNNDSLQLNIPSSSSPFEFSSLALGTDYSCAIRRSNGTVTCWGGRYSGNNNPIKDSKMISIVSGNSFICGIMMRNLSMICWNNTDIIYSSLSVNLKIIPGSCGEESKCEFGIVPDSQNLCSSPGYVICKTQEPVPPLFPPPTIPLTSTDSNGHTRRRLLAFAIVGSVGGLIGVCIVIYWIYIRNCCCRQKKIHNSVQPTITASNVSGDGNILGETSSFFYHSPSIRKFRREVSRSIKRQRSGPSSNHLDRAEEFSFSDLVTATNNFADDNRIGFGGFGSVYKGKLSDGRDVAIKRGENTEAKLKKIHKESAFQSELAFLSRLHHKHLVGLVGYCEEEEEKLLVYEYMKNGSLYDHLHKRIENEPLNSWQKRISICLDAARGIEYLHNYAVPTIIHRDIKSSNILIDANWTAKVSDFGLSIPGEEHTEVPAVGTLGYIDPEYFVLRNLTAKSDVYSFGVVLLEILTGKSAIFKHHQGDGDDNGDGGPISVVDYAVAKIEEGNFLSVLDRRLTLPPEKEAESVELVAYTAVQCVKMEGIYRPTMSDVIVSLERSLSLYEDLKQRTVSSGSGGTSVVSD